MIGRCRSEALETEIVSEQETQASAVGRGGRSDGWQTCMCDVTRESGAVSPICDYGLALMETVASPDGETAKVEATRDNVVRGAGGTGKKSQVKSSPASNLPSIAAPSSETRRSRAPHGGLNPLLARGQSLNQR